MYQSLIEFYRSRKATRHARRYIKIQALEKRREETNGKKEEGGRRERKRAFCIMDHIREHRVFSRNHGCIFSDAVSRAADRTRSSLTNSFVTHGCFARAFKGLARIILYRRCYEALGINILPTIHGRSSKNPLGAFQLYIAEIGRACFAQTARIVRS